MKQTNLYARQDIQNQAQKTGKPPRYWLDTTADEIYKFIGLSLAMAQIPRKGGFRVYWRSDVNGGLVGHNFGRFMTLRRYTDLRKYLHFNDNSEDEQKSDSQVDKLTKIRVVIDTFNTQSKKMFKLGNRASVDEAMIKFFGRTFLRQYMSNKITKYGFKIWCLNDPSTGYFYCISVYAGKRPGEDAVKRLGTKVVMDLVKKAEPMKGSIIVCDRYFGSVHLVLELKKLGYYCICTMQPNRIGFPEELVKIDNKDKRGTIRYATYRDKKISAVGWKDSKGVYLIGSTGEVDGGTCERRI